VELSGRAAAQTSAVFLLVRSHRFRHDSNDHPCPRYRPPRRRPDSRIADHAGLTQQQLADLIGVTYQQAHKYERGINRVSAGRLFQIARALGVPVGTFFEGIEGPQSKIQSARERMCLELAKNFSQIPNERYQEALSQLARALATEH